MIAGDHELGFLTEEDRALADDPSWIPCCAGTAVWGPERCTCWVPVYDVNQAPAVAAFAANTRRTMCIDCAFRPDSPERSEDPYALMDVPLFWCHQGMRRPVEWRHPDGRVRPGDPADYCPPYIGDVPLKADGTPADICAGHVLAQSGRVPR